ncbi:MAG: hypothetical protein QOE61_1355 [Micromonosporaceae bacterium]|jgi:hypothetical protein|nr:hypothetical protein [Micromonosporaceae bacterium]
MITPSPEQSFAQLVADLAATAAELGRRLAVAEPECKISDAEIRGFLARELIDPDDDA